MPRRRHPSPVLLLRRGWRLGPLLLYWETLWLQPQLSRPLRSRLRLSSKIVLLLMMPLLWLSGELLGWPGLRPHLQTALGATCSPRWSLQCLLGPRVGLLLGRLLSALRATESVSCS